jgi:hypothetical protein
VVIDLGGTYRFRQLESPISASGRSHSFRTKGAAETYLRKWLCEKIEEEYRDKDEEEKKEYSSFFDHRTREKRVKKQYRRNLETLERLAENLYEGEYVSVQLEWKLKQVEING